MLYYLLFSRATMQHYVFCPQWRRQGGGAPGSVLAPRWAATFYQQLENCDICSH